MKRKLPLSSEENDKQIKLLMINRYAGKSVAYEEYASLLASIEQTFYNGSMPYKIFQIINVLIEDECMTGKQIYYVFYDSYNKKTRKRPFNEYPESWLQPSIKKAKRLKHLNDEKDTGLGGSDTPSTK